MGRREGSWERGEVDGAFREWKEEIAGEMRCETVEIILPLGLSVVGSKRYAEM